MNEQIKELAKEAGWDMDYEVDGFNLRLEKFYHLVVEAERDHVLSEWESCVQSDLEHGVRILNERAADKWRKEYPAMAGFADTIIEWMDE